jgi:ribosomal protein L22
MATEKNNNSLDTISDLKIASARLKNCPTSPRKMRLVADQV